MSGDCFTCDCAEAIIHGQRVPMPENHDCAYVRSRNELIDQALRIADEKAPITSADDGGRWTGAFSSAMDELARPLLNGKHP